MSHYVSRKDIDRLGDQDFVKSVEEQFLTK